MTFFRIKKIKGKEYGYLVSNQWKSKGSRQKVKGFLGRVHRFELKNPIEFLQFVKAENAEKYINENNASKIIKDLIEWELFKFDVDIKKFSIDLANNKIQNGNRNIVLLINGGFMCNLTLKGLLEFKSENDDNNDGYRLARSFVEAGIKIPQEIFIGLFGKSYNKSK